MEVGGAEIGAGAIVNLFIVLLGIMLALKRPKSFAGVPAVNRWMSFRRIGKGGETLPMT